MKVSFSEVKTALSRLKQYLTNFCSNITLKFKPKLAIIIIELLILVIIAGGVYLLQLRHDNLLRMEILNKQFAYPMLDYEKYDQNIEEGELYVQEIDYSDINYELACGSARTIVHSYLDDYVFYKSSISRTNQKAIFEVIVHNSKQKIKEWNYAVRLIDIVADVRDEFAAFGYNFDVKFFVLDEEDYELVRYIITPDEIEEIK